MDTLFIVIFFSLIGGVFSLAGGFLLLANKNHASSLAQYATSFAAGALLAAAFFDLLKEADHEGDIQVALTATLGGILGFFLLERFLRWFHHHHEHEKEVKSDPSIPLIIIGDTVHNFIDGIAIAAAFLVDIPTGIIVTLAVAAHEIPQEIGDFGLLLHKGMSRKNVILVNISSAFATTIAAVIFYLLGTEVALPLDIILGFVAGFFIYIAVSDIIPDIHRAESERLAGPQTALLILGVVIVGIVTTNLHGVIEASSEDHSHLESSEHHHDE
jgi:zinc and cadmium transporter